MPQVAAIATLIPGLMNQRNVATHVMPAATTTASPARVVGRCLPVLKRSGATVLGAPRMDAEAATAVVTVVAIRVARWRRVAV